MGRQRLQSAMEYLITYGWFFLVAAIVLAALFTLGIFSPGKFISNSCMLPAGFSVTNLQLSQNGILTLNLMQVTQSAINVTAIGCSTNISVANMETFSPTANEISIPIGGNYTFSVPCLYPNGIPVETSIGTQFVGAVAINYTDTSTGLRNTIFCKLFVKAS